MEAGGLTSCYGNDWMKHETKGRKVKMLQKQNDKSCSNLMLILFLPLLAAGGAGLNLVKCLSARGHGDQGIYNFTQCPGSSPS